MKNKYIGIFDSGLGGLNSLKYILDIMPKENTVFFGDTKNSPYGDKNKEEIISLALHDIDVLSRYDLKAVVVACNTCDCNAMNQIKKHCIVPVFGVIDAAVRKALKTTENKKIGVMATEATVRAGAYESRIKAADEEVEVFSIACPRPMETVVLPSPAGVGFTAVTRISFPSFSLLPITSSSGNI